jgi:surface antigen
MVAYCAARAQEAAVSKLYILCLGNKVNWLDSAAKRGFNYSTDIIDIRPNSIAVFSRDSSGLYGHVVFVERMY